VAKRTLKIEVLGDTRDGQRALDGLGVEVEETGGKFDGFADKAAAGLAAGLAVDRIGSFIGSMNDLGLEVETTSAKAKTVFGPALGEMQTWADGLNESLGVTDVQLLGMATDMADLLKPMGFTAEQAAGMSQEMLDLSGALSAWSGGERSAAEVSDILASAMLGERDSLKALGIAINQAEVDERALQIARADGRDEITQMDQALATQQLVLEKSTDAQTAWADGSMDAIKNQNELSATVAELKEGLAQALFPAIAAVTGFLVDDMIPALGAVAGFVVENKEAFIGAGLAITAMLIPAFIGWAASAGAAALATLTAAAPIIAVGVAVAGLTAGIIWAYENVDWFRDSVDAVVEFFRSDFLPILISTKDTLISSFDAAYKFVSPIIDMFVGQVQAMIDIAGGLITFVKGVFTGDWDAAWTGIKDTFSGVWDLITAPLEAFPEMLGNMGGLIAAAAVGMWDGIKNSFRGAINFIIDGWNGLEFKIPGFDPPGPGPKFGGFTLGLPHIDRFHSGGVFTSSTVAGEGLAILQHGERVTPAPAFGQISQGNDAPIYITFELGDETVTRMIERTSDRRPIRVRLA